VRGAGDYANCVGVPIVGGETGFHAGYGDRVLVNAFALGLARRNRIARSGASEPGSRLLCAGRPTGRERSLATKMDASAGRGVVATDPYAEKILLEACLAGVRTGAIVAMHDLGAAGLAGAAFEMASRGGSGVRLDLDRVPLRADGLAAYEIALSETQERMLLAVRRDRQPELLRVFERWGVEVAEVGEATDGDEASVIFGGEEVARLPILPLIEDAPMYRRPVEAPKDLAARQAPPEVPEPGDLAVALEGMLATPELGSKSWIWRQYDHTVRTNTVVGPGGDAAVLLLKGTPSGLAMTSDVNPVYCGLDPASGGEQAVVEAVRNLACVGAEPVGLTNSLSFGDPQSPEVAWQFRETVRGMAAACKALDVPVISGDVSFYDGSAVAGKGKAAPAIPPTPTIAVVGLIPDLVTLPASHFTAAGDRVLLLGTDRGEFGGSAYLRLLHGVEQGRPPKVHLGAEERLADLLRFLAYEGLIHTAHDLAEGGLAVALAEACLGGGLGADLRVEGEPAGLFSETQARAIVAATPAAAKRVLEEAEEFGVPVAELGSVKGDRLQVRCAGAVLDAEVEALHRAWSTALPKALAE